MKNIHPRNAKVGEKGYLGFSVEEQEIIRANSQSSNWKSGRELAKMMGVSVESVRSFRWTRKLSGIEKEGRCLNCGKPLFWIKTKKLFCSTECHRDYKNRKRRIRPRIKQEKICKFCGMPFMVIKPRDKDKHTKQKFCSPECRYKYHLAHNSHPKPIKKICKVCGQEYRTARPTQQFCSKSCASKSRKLGFPLIVWLKKRHPNIHDEWKIYMEKKTRVENE